jgi:hypothetical protein
VRSITPQQDQPTEPHVGAIGRGLAGFWEQVNPKALVEGLIQASNHPLDTAKGILDAQRAPYDKAKESFAKGDYATGARHALAYLLPIIGPALDEQSDKAQQGDVAGAIGGTLGLGAATFGPAEGAKAFTSLRDGLRAARAAEATQAAGRSTADILAALPPTKTAAYTPHDYLAARPYLEAEHANAPITSVQTFRDAADRAISTIEQHVSSYVDAHPTDLIRTNPLDAVVTELSQSPRGTFLDAGLKELSDLPLDQPITLADADRMRLQLNAENRAILKKNQYDAADARKADPGFAAREVVARQLRDGIYQQLEERGIKGVADLRRDEGSIIRLRNAAERQIFSGDASVPGTAKSSTARKAVASVAKYTSTAVGSALGGAPGAVSGATVGEDLAAAIRARLLKRDEMIARAFKSSSGQGPEYPAIPDAPQIRGLLGSGPLVTPPPADTSYVRSVPAQTVFNDRRALPPHVGMVTPEPPADTSFVRGVPGEYARRDVRGVLPPHRRTIVTPPPADKSGVRAVAASKYVVRDPHTGKFKRIYRGD